MFAQWSVYYVGNLWFQFRLDGHQNEMKGPEDRLYIREKKEIIREFGEGSMRERESVCEKKRESVSEISYIRRETDRMKEREGEKMKKRENKEEGVR